MTDKPIGLDAFPSVYRGVEGEWLKSPEEAWWRDWSAAWAGIGWLASTDHVLRLMDRFVGRVVENFAALSRQVDNLAVDVRKLAKATRP